MKWPRTGFLGKIRWYYRQWRYGPFNEIALPIITNCFSNFDIKEFVSIEPLSEPCGLVFYLDIHDEQDPLEGQVFRIKPKHYLTHPEWYDCHCCMKGPYWHKIWNNGHWTYEQNLTEEEWKSLVEKYKV
jgi:hypothetical protein